MSRALPLVFLVLLAGCYSYVPQRPGSVPLGADVRVRITSDGVQRLGEAYGSVSGIVEGRLESWSDQVEITFPVPATPGMVDRGLRNKLIISQADIVGIDLRERDRTKTAILSASLGALTAGTAYAMFSGVFGGSQNNDPILPEDIVIPFGIRIFP
jgi:hypothetical protein